MPFREPKTNLSKEDLEKIRVEKANNRGSFEKNLFLIHTSKSD